MSKGGDSSNSASAQTPSQWASALTNASISAWKEADILGFSVAQLKALSPGQISNISVPWAVPMAVWTAETLNAVPLQYWSQWGTRYLSTTSNGVTSITPLSQSSNGAVSGKNNWFDDVGRGASGFSFTPSVVAGISNERIAQIGAGLGRNQSQAPSLPTNAGYVSPSDFSAALSVATASGANVVTWHISASQTAYMFASGWADMGADFMGALTYSQLGAIAHPESALGAAQFGYLSANQLSALGQMDWSKVTSAQLNATKISVFQGLQSHILQAISAQTWAGLDQAHTAVLTAADVQLLPATTIAQMNYFGYALTASVGAVLSAAQVASISSACWAQISDSQFLNSLSTAAFQAIPVSAFASMVDAVVGSLDHVHVAALTPNQAKSYPLSKLSDASSALYQNPNTLNFATFVSQSNVNWALAPASFIKLLTSAQLRLISPVQIAALSPTALSALTRAQTQALSLAQIQALNARQLSAMVYISRHTDVVQEVFSARQLGQLSMSFWSNVNSNFLNALALNAFQAMTTAQLQAISAGAFANLDQAHVNALTGTQLLALTAEQVGQFSGAYLSIAFLRGMRLAAFKGLVPDQMHHLHDYLFNTVASNAFSTTDPTRIKNAENQFASLLASILESDDGREAWLQQSINLLTQLRWLDPTAAANLLASDVTATYSALNWSWMSGTFLNSINTMAFAQLKASSVAQFNLSALAELNDTHLQVLTVTQAAALSGVQLSVIGHLGALSASVVRSLSATQLAGIHQDWSQISTRFLNNMTASQFMNLPPAQFGQLTAAQLGATAIDWRLISPAQLNALSLSEFEKLCTGANPAILHTTVGVVLGLGGEQTAILARSATHYSAAQMNTLLNRLFGAFSSEQTSRLVDLMKKDSADEIVLQSGLVALLAKIDGTTDGIEAAIQTMVSLRKMQPDWFSAANLSAVLPALSEQYSRYLQNYQAGITTQNMYHYVFLSQSLSNLLQARQGAGLAGQERTAMATSTSLALGNLLVMIGAGINSLGLAIKAGSDNKLSKKERDNLIASASLNAVAALAQGMQLGVNVILRALRQYYAGAAAGVDIVDDNIAIRPQPAVDPAVAEAVGHAFEQQRDVAYERSAAARGSVAPDLPARSPSSADAPVHGPPLPRGAEGGLVPDIPVAPVIRAVEPPPIPSRQFSAASEAVRDVVTARVAEMAPLPALRPPIDTLDAQAQENERLIRTVRQEGSAGDATRARSGYSPELDVQARIVSLNNGVVVIAVDDGESVFVSKFTKLSPSGVSHDEIGRDAKLFEAAQRAIATYKTAHPTENINPLVIVTHVNDYSQQFQVEVMQRAVETAINGGADSKLAEFALKHLGRFTYTVWKFVSALSTSAQPLAFDAEAVTQRTTQLLETLLGVPHQPLPANAEAPIGSLMGDVAAIVAKLNQTGFVNFMVEDALAEGLARGDVGYGDTPGLQKIASDALHAYGSTEIVTELTVRSALAQIARRSIIQAVTTQWVREILANPIDSAATARTFYLEIGVQLEQAGLDLMANDVKSAKLNAIADILNELAIRASTDPLVRAVNVLIDSRKVPGLTSNYHLRGYVDQFLTTAVTSNAHEYVRIAKVKGGENAIDIDRTVRNARLRIFSALETFTARLRDGMDLSLDFERVPLTPFELELRNVILKAGLNVLVKQVIDFNLNAMDMAQIMTGKDPLALATMANKMRNGIVELLEKWDRQTVITDIATMRTQAYSVLRQEIFERVGGIVSTWAIEKANREGTGVVDTAYVREILAQFRTGLDQVTRPALQETQYAILLETRSPLYQKILETIAIKGHLVAEVTDRSPTLRPAAVETVVLPPPAIAPPKPAPVLDVNAVLSDLKMDFVLVRDSSRKLNVLETVRNALEVAHAQSLRAIKSSRGEVEYEKWSASEEQLFKEANYAALKRVLAVVVENIRVGTGMNALATLVLNGTRNTTNIVVDQLKAEMLIWNERFAEVVREGAAEAAVDNTELNTLLRPLMNQSRTNMVSELLVHWVAMQVGHSRTVDLTFISSLITAVKEQISAGMFVENYLTSTDRAPALIYRELMHNIQKRGIKVLDGDTAVSDRVVTPDLVTPELLLSRARIGLKQEVLVLIKEFLTTSFGKSANSYADMCRNLAVLAASPKKGDAVLQSFIQRLGHNADFEKAWRLGLIDLSKELTSDLFFSVVVAAVKNAELPWLVDAATMATSTPKHLGSFDRNWQTISATVKSEVRKYFSDTVLNLADNVNTNNNKLTQDFTHLLVDAVLGRGGDLNNPSHVADSLGEVFNDLHRQAYRIISEEQLKQFAIDHALSVEGGQLNENLQVTFEDIALVLSEKAYARRVADRGPGGEPMPPQELTAVMQRKLGTLIVISPSQLTALLKDFVANKFPGGVAVPGGRPLVVVPVNKDLSMAFAVRLGEFAVQRARSALPHGEFLPITEEPMQQAAIAVLRDFYAAQPSLDMKLMLVNFARSNALRVNRDGSLNKVIDLQIGAFSHSVEAAWQAHNNQAARADVSRIDLAQFNAHVVGLTDLDIARLNSYIAAQSAHIVGFGDAAVLTTQFMPILTHAGLSDVPVVRVANPPPVVHTPPVVQPPVVVKSPPVVVKPPTAVGASVAEDVGDNVTRALAEFIIARAKTTSKLLSVSSEDIPLGILKSEIARTIRDIGIFPVWIKRISENYGLTADATTFEINKALNISAQAVVDAVFVAWADDAQARGRVAPVDTPEIRAQQYRNIQQASLDVFQQNIGQALVEMGKVTPVLANNDLTHAFADFLAKSVADGINNTVSYSRLEKKAIHGDLLKTEVEGFMKGVASGDRQYRQSLLEFAETHDWTVDAQGRLNKPLNLTVDILGDALDRALVQEARSRGAPPPKPKDMQRVCARLGQADMLADPQVFTAQLQYTLVDIEVYGAKPTVALAQRRAGLAQKGFIWPAAPTLEVASPANKVKQKLQAWFGDRDAPAEPQIASPEAVVRQTPTAKFERFLARLIVDRAVIQGHEDISDAYARATQDVLDAMKNNAEMREQVTAFAAEAGLIIEDHALNKAINLMPKSLAEAIQHEVIRGAALRGEDLPVMYPEWLSAKISARVHLRDFVSFFTVLLQQTPPARGTTQDISVRPELTARANAFFARLIVDHADRLGFATIGDLYINNPNILQGLEIMGAVYTQAAQQVLYAIQNNQDVRGMVADFIAEHELAIEGGTFNKVIKLTPDSLANAILIEARRVAAFRKGESPVTHAEDIASARYIDGLSSMLSEHVNVQDFAGSVMSVLQEKQPTTGIEEAELFGARGGARAKATPRAPTPEPVVPAPERPISPHIPPAAREGARAGGEPDVPERPASPLPPRAAIECRGQIISDTAIDCFVAILSS